MPKKSDAVDDFCPDADYPHRGKKIKFYVVSCSCGGSVKMDIVDEFTFKTKNEARGYVAACNTRCDNCDVQIHGPFEVERKP